MRITRYTIDRQCSGDRRHQTTGDPSPNRFQTLLYVSCRFANGVSL